MHFKYCESVRHETLLLSNFAGVRQFLLLFTFFTWEILKIWSSTLHSSMLFYVSLLSRVYVCWLRWSCVVPHLSTPTDHRVLDKWDVASSCRSMETSCPNPPAGPLLFYLLFCFLILPVWEDFSFCLHSSHWKSWRFYRFPCILECLFFVSLFSSLCVWWLGG